MNVLTVQEELRPETALVFAPYGELQVDGDDPYNQNLSWLSYNDGETLPLCREDVLRGVEPERGPRYPSWEPFELRLALMTTSETFLLSEEFRLCRRSTTSPSGSRCG